MRRRIGFARFNVKTTTTTTTTAECLDNAAFKELSYSETII